jgi:hypothetical protein
MPDSAACAGKWKDFENGPYVLNPNITVDRLPPAFNISGSKARVEMNGVYKLTDEVCADMPVYRMTTRGNGLYKPNGMPHWVVSVGSMTNECSNLSYIESSPYECTGIMPDSAACAGKWKDYETTGWVPNPDITVVRLPVV